MTSNRVLAICIAAALLVVPSATKAGNVLVDPGFEFHTPSAQGGWLLFGGQFASNHARSGSWSMFDQFCELYGVAGTFEQFPAAPGSRWRMTGYGLSPVQVLGSPASAFGIIQVTFFDAQGNDLGTVETTGAPFPAKTSVHIDATTTPLEWQFLDTETVTAPAGAAYIQAFTLWIDYTGQGSCQGVYFDDLQLEVLVSNHGQYVSSIARNAAALVAAGLITQTQAVAMVEAAASSMGGK